MTGRRATSSRSDALPVEGAELGTIEYGGPGAWPSMRAGAARPLLRASQRNPPIFRLLPTYNAARRSFEAMRARPQGEASEIAMHAESPEDICRLFQSCMARGDIEAILGLYDAEIAFVNEAGVVKSGLRELRAELAPLAAATPRFDFEVKQVARSGDIALMHTWWTVSSSAHEPRSVHAIEVAR